MLMTIFTLPRYSDVFPNTICSFIAAWIVCLACVTGCTSVQSEKPLTSTPIPSATAPLVLTSTRVSIITPSPTSASHFLSAYGFPDTIDTAKQYLFYLHGRIIEDQGIPAISPDYGEYEYAAILEKLAGYGFVVISEQRPVNTDVIKYANKISDQIRNLLAAGVPAKNISVVGASKGAAITIYISHNLKNEEINYVIMGICHPDVLADLKREQIYLSGNVLSIYDSVDEYAGSCQVLFTISEGKGIARYDEIILKIGTGHGILYKPLDEWIYPVVNWAGKP